MAVASSSCSPAIAVDELVPVERGRDLDGDRAAERHEADLHLVGDLGDEVGGGLLRRGEAVRGDVGGLHRQRHVEGEDDAALADESVRWSS